MLTGKVQTQMYDLENMHQADFNIEQANILHNVKVLNLVYPTDSSSTWTHVILSST